MKDNIMQRLYAVLNALNNVSVSGKQNLANLSGSISVLEEVLNSLDGLDIIDPASQEREEE
jgi:hypothetical protein